MFAEIIRFFGNKYLEYQNSEDAIQTFHFDIGRKRYEVSFEDKYVDIKVTIKTPRITFDFNICKRLETVDEFVEIVKKHLEYTSSQYIDIASEL